MRAAAGVPDEATDTLSMSRNGKAHRMRETQQDDDVVQVRSRLENHAIPKQLSISAPNKWHLF